MDTGTRPFPIIRVFDEAISTATPEHAAAALKNNETRDASVLSFVPGESPTVFWGRHLSPTERRFVRNKISQSDQYEAAFVTGLVKVDALTYPDGSRRDWVRPSDRSGKEKPIPDADLDSFFDEAMVQEIGMVIMQRSFLARTKGHWYPLPAICQDALRARLLLHAVQTRGSSKSPESKQPPGGPPATPPTSSPDGGASTGATATG